MKKNFLYNAFYNVLVLILPLITVPYISRVMSAEKIGVYSYSYSIASYFGIFILLGLNNYGNRSIAKVRDDKKALSKTFWSIYLMQIIMATIIIIIYINYVLFVALNKTMAMIQLIYLISVALDINWFFFGMEQFKLTVTRNTIIKVLNVILILLFVNDQKDIYIYAFIMTIGPLLSQIVLWTFLKKYISVEKIQFKNVIPHIRPNIILFIPIIAISLYNVMDKIMLGIMSNMSEVGYFENANKLTQIPVMAIASLGTVMLPRMSNLIANGKKIEAMKYIQKSFVVSILLSSPMAFGLSAISKEFVPLFYGNGYIKCIYLIPILILASIFISWANVIRTQYLVPNEKNRIFIGSVFLGAIVNMIINVLLIPYLQSIGAAIGTIIAEFSVCAYQTYMVRKEIEVWRYLKQSLPLLLSGIIMYFAVVNVPFIFSNLITLCVKILLGGVIYLLLLGWYYKYGLKDILKK
ncbi:flippase [Mediterraneibacter gnavus]|uniref:flippase n=1 Tax=Mediterraneibacter gnavus TaxID=33038 RepID=UPI0023304A24|nr:flippase [Mediterraneibacter gnavus]MDB8711931.1 flippase [Mediterraneibacter gnavus]MDB8714975.1 flippase [Mediterraneibacter gnavus]